MNARSFRFGDSISHTGNSRSAWRGRVREVEDLGYDVLQVPDHLGTAAPFRRWWPRPMRPASGWGPTHSTSAYRVRPIFQNYALPHMTPLSDLTMCGTNHLARLSF